MTTAVATAPISFQYVEEHDAFLALFPHRYDYLWADFARPSTPSVLREQYSKPQWKTERRYPLSDRMIQRGAALYGVRFGRETRYCLLDIDIGSRFHPRQDPFALTPILEALENLGLIAHIACTSSQSGGIHLYFPLDQPYPSWLVGLAVTQVLKDAGIWVTPGQVEVFPNARTAELSQDSHLALFNGHRLPLQAGSYLLDSDLQPLGRSHSSFVSQWQFCARQNQLSSQILRKTAYGQRHAKSLHSQRVKKFFNDLNVEIEIGWTGPGQTNRLLGRIAMRSYIFHHAIYGGEPLEGQDLVDNIVAVARSLPGYQEWCQHQHEITDRAVEWARAVEKSHYFHYGDRLSKKQSEQELVQDVTRPEFLRASESWNTQQATKTQLKIKKTVKDLLKQNQLPEQTTLRFKALVNQGIGGASLYKYKELWHPDYLDLQNLEVEQVTQKEQLSDWKGKRDNELEAKKVQASFKKTSEPMTSLFVWLDCNSSQGKGFEDLERASLASNFSLLSFLSQPFRKLGSWFSSGDLLGQLVFSQGRTGDFQNTDCFLEFLLLENTDLYHESYGLGQGRSPP